jgi:hypothetical protein
MASIHFKLGDYMQGKYKVAMSLPEITEQTNNFSVKNAPGCVATLTGSSPKELFLRYNVTCHLKKSDPAGHEVKIRFDLDAITDETKSKDLDVYAACSCPAFLYWGAQWNLHQRDALEGESRPLLTAPTERLDLRNHFLICKHVKVVMDRILPSVQHNIVKIVRKRHVDKYHLEHPEPKLEPVPKRKLPATPKAEVLPAPPPAIPAKKVIERSTPATPEEREKVPVLKEQPVTPTPVVEAEPAAAAASPKPAPTPIPMIDDLEDETPVPAPVAEPKKSPVAPKKPEPKKPAPEKKETKSSPTNTQKLTDRDRKFMEKLQQDQQKRLDRQNKERTKKAPGKRP